jgi:hypothetical protein
LLMMDLAVFKAHGGVAAIVGRETGGIDDVPDFGWAAMNEFGAEFDGERAKRIVHCENPAADALARFETQRLTAGAGELAEGGESGGASADDRYFAVEGQCFSSLSRGALAANTMMVTCRAPLTTWTP